MTNIKNKIKNIFTNVLNLNKKKINKKIKLKDLEIDSLDLIEIIMEIEKKFNIQIKDEKIEKLTTIKKIIKYVKKKKKKKKKKN